MLTPAEQLSSNGALADHIDGFAPRAVQQQMATAIDEAIHNQASLVTEAGTGTGKTFAYLVPALMSGKKVIISTGTKTLQDQLFHRDLPTVRDALGLPVDIALLKGRANYLCLHRLFLSGERNRFRNKSISAQWQQVRDWEVHTVSGDIAECREVTEDAVIWPHVTANADNCLGSDCPQFNDCYMIKSRRRAQKADVLVVNHHLLLADMSLRDDGFGEVVPSANAYIIDEAHQLPEAAMQFFGSRLSSRQLTELASDATAEQLKDASEAKGITAAAEVLTKASADLRLAFGQSAQRSGWGDLINSKPMQTAIADLADALQLLQGKLEPNAERGRGLEHCLNRCQSLIKLLPRLTEKTEEDVIQWFQTYRNSFSLHITPMEVAEIFRRHMKESRAAWIFSSATLAVADSFEHFTTRMGLDDADCERWDSPFDFEQQALLYIPQDCPEPNSYQYTQAVVNNALPVLQASRGRAFMLFTSHRALREAESLLNKKIDYPLLVQGDKPRSELLRQFRELGNAVLLGTASFWEGIDVRGEALSCVIIDKLPFASPGDPVLKARIDAIRASGENPFMSYQLPAAVLTLKQGAGRLIRDQSDSGVLMICDPRLYSKPYGRLFLSSLPAMPRSRDVTDVQKFFSTHEIDEPAVEVAQE